LASARRRLETASIAPTGPQHCIPYGDYPRRLLASHRAAI